MFDGLGEMLDGHCVLVERGEIARLAPEAEFTVRALEHARATVRGGITSVEHGIFMSDECIEEMIT
ncbi:MAG: hypothetical protein ACR2RL_02555, partial [Gammaproteobacteria bacterium]